MAGKGVRGACLWRAASERGRSRDGGVRCPRCGFDVAQDHFGVLIFLATRRYQAARTAPQACRLISPAMSCAVPAVSYFARVAPSV